LKPLARRFSAAKRRCTNPNDPGYDRYGGRGIRFEFGSPTDAAIWFAKKYPDWQGKEIDRRDNDGPYSKANVRAVTCQENNLNKRTSSFMTHQGTKIPMPHVPHVARYLYPELDFCDTYYATLKNKKGLRTLTQVRDYHRRVKPDKPRGRTIFSTPDLAIVSLYIRDAS
jgi:hypothetical protein